MNDVVTTPVPNGHSGTAPIDIEQHVLALAKNNYHHDHDHYDGSVFDEYEVEHNAEQLFDEASSMNFVGTGQVHRQESTSSTMVPPQRARKGWYASEDSRPRLL